MAEDVLEKAFYFGQKLDSFRRCLRTCKSTISIREGFSLNVLRDLCLCIISLTRKTHFHLSIDTNLLYRQLVTRIVQMLRTSLEKCHQRRQFIHVIRIKRQRLTSIRIPTYLKSVTNKCQPILVQGLQHGF